MRYIGMLLICLGISACVKDDEITFLEGYYSLIDISCNCSPFHLIPGQQQIKLDTIDRILDVKVFGEVENGLFLSQNEYEYDIDNDSLFISGMKFRLSNNGDVIVLSSFPHPQIFDLDRSYIFEKN